MWTSYLSSKAAFDAWLRTAEPELALDGVRVSTVHLPLVRTRMSAPTVHYARMPAMSADDAAAAVCRAICRRTRWAPWWVRPGRVVTGALPQTSGRVMTSALRVGRALEPVRALGSTGLLAPFALGRLAFGVARSGPTLAACLAAGADDDVALVDAAGPVTRGELRRLVPVAAQRLSAAGVAVRRGGAVPVEGLDGRDLVAALVAVTRAGADAVVLPPDLPAQRRPQVLAALAGRGDGAGRIVCLTSGTTGVPRGVARPVSPRLLLGPATTHLAHVPLRRGRPIVVAAPLHHGYGLTYLAAGLALGCPVVLGATTAPPDLLAVTSQRRARVLVLLPTQLHRICAHLEATGADLPLDLPHLRAVVSGAAPLPVALLDRARAVFGDRIVNLYGTTEAGWAAIAGPRDLRAAPGSVGRAPRGVRLRVVSPAGDPLPRNRIGEVQVRGWSADGRWQATGDLGRLDLAGRLHLEGRVDDLVVSGGENVYPGPVLRVVTSHPDVEDGVVGPVPDDEFGQRLRVVAQRRPGSALTAEELREWLRSRLSRAERPRDVEVVDALPRTATGKPLRPV